MRGSAILVKPGALNVVDNVAVELSGSQVVTTAAVATRACTGSRECELPLNSVAVYPLVRGAWCGGASADEVVQPAVVMWSIGASSVVERERRLFVPFSVVLQVDGLMSALLRLRIERDVFATAAVQSACKFYGCERWRSWSTFIGWFFTGLDITVIKRSLAAAEVHHALIRGLRSPQVHGS